ncbi:MAG: hypothetical protein EBV36_04580 [Burkholderiaceae bacterium]|nr:hypothetical protein [Burkholderiaceae bacterium]
MSTPLVALEGFWLAQAMKYSTWLYPTVETVHIWGVGMLFGSVVLMDLCVLGLGKALDYSALSRLGIAISLLGFSLAVLTGSILFITHAGDLIASRLFILKMCLIFLLITNAVLLRMRVVINAATKVQAVISLVGWASVIGLGRWLAYV